MNNSQVYDYIKNNPRQTLAEISRGLNLLPMAVAKELNELFEQGYIRKKTPVYEVCSEGLDADKGGYT